MLKVEELLNFDLNSIPRYILMRDVLKLDSKNEELIIAKSMVFQSKWVKDNIQFPLSNSWRNHVNRKIDCTVRVQKILSRLDK